jgi:gamma-glutamyl hercynylcysteine S-oxide synthase
MPNTIEAPRQGHAVENQIFDRLLQARRQTDELFKIVAPSALYDRPIAERHRIIFYIGHLESFDWNLFRDRLLTIPAFNPEFDKLFAFGIDPVDGGLPKDEPGDWPSLNRVRDYVEHLRGRIDERLADLDFATGKTSTETDFAPDTLLNVAIEHRLMHAETLAYMFHQLPYDSKIAPAPEPALATPPLTSRMIELPEGIATLGLARTDSDAFGWDNEFEAHTAFVPAFAVDNHKVTNQQFLGFLNAGGYDARELWRPEDWEWKQSAGISHPVFWKQAADTWRYRTMFAEVPLPMDWPVYVSHAEACAYARWINKSLPTEAQWHRAAYATREGIERQYPWGKESPTHRKSNFDFVRWNPTPVGAFPDGTSAFGVHDLAGNGWEWTSSVFEPFNGFQPFSFYPGYSANFFDGKHYVMKGGSSRTASSMLRRSFRNWFQPHYQYVYAGFRCVSN